MIAGIFIMLYPFLSDRLNSRRQSEVINSYSQITDKSSEKKKEKIWNDAVLYNKRIAEGKISYYASDSLSEDDGKENKGKKSGKKGGKSKNKSGSNSKGKSKSEGNSNNNSNSYESLLDITGTGIMGYIDIPEINVHLPVYHGTSPEILQNAAGHVEGTSLPVGGKSSRCVITGHTGLPSAKLFTDLDELEAGDTFQLNVLDKTLTYQVCHIKTVLPEDVASIRIKKGEDLVTLVTCTPYGINTHRLLVTGKRIKTPAEGEETGSADKEKGVRGFFKKYGIWLALSGIIIILSLAFLLRYKANRKKKDVTRGDKNVKQEQKGKDRKK